MQSSRREFLTRSFCAGALSVWPSALWANSNPHILEEFADQIVQRILDTAERNRASSQDHPLMVMLGETHNQLPHLILQLLVLDKLRNSGANFCTGLEFSHDHLFKSYSNVMENNWQNWNRDLVSPVKSRDPDGQLTLKSILLNQASVALYGHQVIWNYLHAQQIPSQANDAAWAKVDEPSRVDLRDPLTLEYVEGLFPQGKATLPLTSVEGLLLRNHMMSDMAATFAKDNGADIHVQLCGSGHIKGTLMPARPFADTLPALYAQQSIPFLAIPIVNERDPNNIARDFSLAHASFIGGIVPPFHTIQNEEAEMNAYLRSVGLEECIIDAAQLQRNIRTEFSRLFPVWREEFENSPSTPSNDI